MRRFLATATVATVAAASLAGCGSQNATTSPSPSSEESATQAGVAAPLILSPEELTTTPVEITAKRPLVIKVNDQPERWTEGSVDDTTVATFNPGRYDGSAWFNPGINAANPGVTTAHVKNPDSGETITFTVKVVPV